MAQRSVRRDRENQMMDMRLERARLNWTRSAYSHTGPRHVKGRIRGRTHVSTRSHAAPSNKILLASTGASTHVHHDDIAWLQGGHETLFQIGLEDRAVHRPVDDEGRRYRVTSQARDEGRDLPVAVRNFADQPLSAPAAASGAGHVGAGAGLVDEDQPGAIKQLLRVFPALPCRRYVGAVLFAGVDGFF